MFDFVAKHKRILQIVLFLTIIPFAFFGLESYTRSIGGAGEVAVVDGSPVTQREFGDEMRRQQERLQEMLGRGADMSAFDTPELRMAVLESMISQRLVLSEVARGRLALSKPEVISSILAAPEFHEGGKFSSERYAMYLRSRGMSDEGNVSLLRMEIPAARLATAISATAFQPRAVAGRLLALEAQKREVSEVVLAAAPYLKGLKFDEDKLRAYYDANPSQFKLPESVRAEYLVLSAEALGAAEPVAEGEMKALYDARASQLGPGEQRRASHILLKTKEEAEQVLAEARKAPQRFGELAKKRSQDPGSAENGGDLGFNARGGLASKALDEAVFSLKSGEISDVVSSEFGFHVIRLAAIQPAKVPSFEEARKELAADLQKQKGQKKFAEVAEAFNNLVYEQSDSLKPAAERYKLKIATSDWLSRGTVQGQGPLGHPKLAAALFSPDAVQQKRNTDAVEVAPGTLVAARVLEHKPEAQRPFDEVKGEIERQLLRQESRALAQKEGTEKLAALAKGEATGLQWSAPKLVSRRETQGIGPAAMRRIMAADVAKLPVHVGAERGDDGYVLYRISKVVPGEVKPAPQNAEELQRLDRGAGSDQFEAYVASLRARAKIEINRANLEKR